MKKNTIGYIINAKHRWNNGKLVRVTGFSLGINREPCVEYTKGCNIHAESCENGVKIEKFILGARNFRPF